MVDHNGKNCAACCSQYEEVVHLVCMDHLLERDNYCYTRKFMLMPRTKDDFAPTRKLRGTRGLHGPCFKFHHSLLCTIFAFISLWQIQRIHWQSQIVTSAAWSGLGYEDILTNSESTHNDETGTERRDSTTTMQSRFNESETANESLHASLVFGAYFANGSLGYVADPQALTRHYQEFVLRTNASFADVIQQYCSESILPSSKIQSITTLDDVCSQPAGNMDEAPEGVKLLTRQVQVHGPAYDDTQGRTPTRLLCAIYTHKPMRNLARMAAITYGHKCDGFLAFSTETIPALGLVHLHHMGPESYQNMWQKVRSIWTYIRTYYSNDYDFFHLGGDDMYVIVENLRGFLTGLPNEQPLHLGLWVRQKRFPYVAGGPGYTLNRQALVRLVDVSLSQGCHARTVAPYEDKLVSECLRGVQVFPFDARHNRTGQPRYHASQPSTIFTTRARTGRGASFQARIVAYLESLPHPTEVNGSVAPLLGLGAASPDSVSFHNIHNDVYMARVHAILYGSCPKESALGQNLSDLTIEAAG